jgi:glycosyltransferase involved in cell wall biosynthesis
MKLNNKPKISIVSASYNHEKYVGQFIDSILQQTFNNFELIIIDDASIDNNLKIIKNYQDPRIKIIEHRFNMGPSISVNDGIKISKGEYIALMASDDNCKKTYLEEGINFLEKNKQYNALCFQLNGINENGEPLKNKKIQKILKHINLGNERLIRDMFLLGNMLPAPGEIIRKSIIKKTGLFNNALLQTQDYDFHIKTLLGNNKIYVYQKPLINYRISSNNSNVDNHSEIANIRKNIEMEYILNNFLNIEYNTFIRIFKKNYIKFGKPNPKTMPYFLGLMALNTNDKERKVWGYKTILNFIKINNNLKLLNSLYKTTYKEIVDLLKKYGF